MRGFAAVTRRRGARWAAAVTAALSVVLAWVVADGTPLHAAPPSQAQTPRTARSPSAVPPPAVAPSRDAAAQPRSATPCELDDGDDLSYTLCRHAHDLQRGCAGVEAPYSAHCGRCFLAANALPCDQLDGPAAASCRRARGELSACSSSGDDPVACIARAHQASLVTTASTQPKKASAR